MSIPGAQLAWRAINFIDAIAFGGLSIGLLLAQLGQCISANDGNHVKTNSGCHYLDHHVCHPGICILRTACKLNHDLDFHL
jgi:hypothetical protein